MALSTGYMSVQYKSSVLDNFGFFMVLVQEAPLTTLKLMFIEKPLFIVEAKHSTTAASVWALHYFGLTILIHIAVAVIIAGIIARAGSALRWRDIPFSGTVLLLFSSLYLLLSSCCTGGPNWIFHTWLLSVVFNPISSSNATIQLYQTLREWFVLLQILLGAMGGLLMFRHQRQRCEETVS